MNEEKVKITLIGTSLARPGLEFIYEGELAECEGCKVFKVCNNLQPKKRYRIVGLRNGAMHECRIHHENVCAVEVIESPVNQTTLTQRYTEEAVKFIRSNADGPFFLYFPHTMVHVPLFVSDDRHEADPMKAYKLAAEHIDWSVGEVLKTLDDLGIADNTLIVYSSDNGPWLSKKHHGGSALPLRAGKGTTYEGGMRVPGIMRWPAHIPAGTVSDEVVGTIDLLPTFASITGAQVPEHPIDGLDVSALLADPKAPSPHRMIGYFYYRNSKVEAVRRGKWKLRVAGKEMELYDLDADIGETTNLASSNSRVVHELQALIASYDADLKANTRPIWRATTR